MQSGLQALLLCTDDKVVKVLRRVLGELEIGIEHCLDTEAASQKLTRQRFEAVIVDCTSLESASRALNITRSAPANKRAITVAIIDGESSLKGSSELGAHFVLYKPISLERTKSSFRSVRALMKRERRRHARIPIQLPVELHYGTGSGTVQSVTLDVGENGMAIKAKGWKLPSSFHVRFTLPGVNADIESLAEVAWEGNQVQGIRFRDLCSDASAGLKSWISRQLAGADSEEPPVKCKLTDLSLGACYLQTESPFPVRTRLQLIIKIRDLEVQVEGIVRVMHSEAGMGVEFTQHTPAHRTKVQDFIQTLVSTSGAIPDVQVRPDTIDNSAEAIASESLGGEQGDPLLSLFQTKTKLPLDLFQSELHKQRGTTREAGA
jgi:hypothetical protein